MKKLLTILGLMLGLTTLSVAAEKEIKVGITQIVEHPSLDAAKKGVEKALKEKGVKIPKDISIIGFDDIPYSAVSSPALTTVHVQRKQIGKLAVEQLLKIKKDKKNKPVKTLITGNLIIRDSVAKKA